MFTLPMQDIEMSCDAVVPHPLVARLFFDMLGRQQRQQQLQQPRAAHGGGCDRLPPVVELKPVSVSELPPIILAFLET